ncbi:hypothetical protein EJB05_25406, partial [Eragrostis curvula]
MLIVGEITRSVEISQNQNASAPRNAANRQLSASRRRTPSASATFFFISDAARSASSCRAFSKNTPRLSTALSRSIAAACALSAAFSSRSFTASADVDAACALSPAFSSLSRAISTDDDAALAVSAAFSSRSPAAARSTTASLTRVRIQDARFLASARSAAADMCSTRTAAHSSMPSAAARVSRVAAADSLACFARNADTVAWMSRPEAAKQASTSRGSASGKTRRSASRGSNSSGLCTAAPTHGEKRPRLER